MERGFMFMRLAFVFIFIFLFALLGCSLKCEYSSNCDFIKAANKQMYTKNMKLLPKQMEEDLAFLELIIISSHPNPFAYTSKHKFEAQRKIAHQKIKQSQTIDDFYIIAANLAASLKNAHTKLEIPSGWVSRINSGKVFPILIKVYDNKIYLLDYMGEKKIPKNSEIITIDGKPAIAIMQKFASYFPKEASLGNYNKLELAKFIWFCMAIEFKNKHNISVEIKTASGEIMLFEISSIDVNEAIKRIHVPVADKNSLPLYYSLIEKNNTGLITINSFGNPTNYKKNCKEIFKKIKRDNINNLIIDIRDCPGGSSKSVDVLVDYIAHKPWRQFKEVHTKMSCMYINQRNPKYFFFRPEVGSIRKLSNLPMLPNIFNLNRFCGNVYLLINQNSYSASVDFAAVVKHYKFGTLVGEETGDPINHYGDSLCYSLPNSRIKGFVASKYFIGPSEQSIIGQGILPDHEILGIRHNRNSNDAVLEFALGLIQGK